ncbi:MAG: peptidoglycan DD-metalloendopeptidase family protein [Bacteroidetes bacterium]|nr:peptidoglycan DD-metalloendopeptidase family protein [Bacteroidota bacterium]
MTYFNEPFPVLGYHPKPESLQKIDLSSSNKQLQEEGLAQFLTNTLAKDKIGYGGYLEHRTFYLRSNLFSNDHRTLHLGIDLWMEADTKIYCPLDGIVHSFANNDNYLDYGPTIILQHQTAKGTLFSLYGHLSLESLDGLQTGMPLSKGTPFASLGAEAVNGNWPPHLHLQCMTDMENRSGDFPGVVEMKDKAYFSGICPNPLPLCGIQS